MLAVAPAQYSRIARVVPATMLSHISELVITWVNFSARLKQNVCVFVKLGRYNKIGGLFLATFTALQDVLGCF